MANKKNADIAEKVYWRDNKHFADLFNTVFFDGRQVIREEELTEADSEVSNYVFSKEDVSAISKTRDMIKKASANADFVFLGIENQSHIHYGMPLRTMLYDALSYLKQCENLQKRHKMAGDTENSDEFLSGLKKESRLHPVFTIIVYYGEKTWDGPKKLSDMMNFTEEWKTIFQDYGMRLIEVINGEMLPFQNEENRLLFQMIKDVNRLSKKELLEKYKSENISKSVVITVGKVTGTKALVDWALQREGDEIMCTNMDRIFAEERAEGRQEGIEEGRKAGLEEARREIIQRMLSKGMDKERIADILDIFIDEIKTVCTVV